MFNLYRQGLGTDTIARRLDLGKTTIRKYLLRSNARFRPAPKDVISSKLHKKFIKLYKKGLSIKKIAELCNSTFATVNRHLHKEGITLKKRGDPIFIQNSDYRKLSLEKAYILGVIGPGDGFIEKRKKEGIYRLVLDVADKDFLEYSVYCLEKVYGIKPRIEKITKRRKNDRERLKAVLQSKAVYEDILSYNADFRERTWNIPRAIKTANKKIQSKYIQGFADSQSHVGNHPTQRAIILCNKNESGKREIREILRNLKIKANIHENWLTITGKKYIERYQNQVNFTMERKRVALDNLLNRYQRVQRIQEDLVKLKTSVIEQRKKGLILSIIANNNDISIGYASTIINHSRGQVA